MLSKDELISILKGANDTRTHNVGRSIELTESALSSCKRRDCIDLKAKALSQLSLYYMIIGKNEESLENA